MLARAIAELEEKQQRQTVTDEKFVRQQRILDDRAPRAWKELRDAVRTGCEKYPKHFKFEVQPENLIRVRCLIRKATVEVNYLPASKTIEFQCGEDSRDFFIALDGNNRAVLVDSEERIYPPKQLAELLLEAGL